MSQHVDPLLEHKLPCFIHQHSAKQPRRRAPPQRKTPNAVCLPGLQRAPARHAQGQFPLPQQPEQLHLLTMQAHSQSNKDVGIPADAVLLPYPIMPRFEQQRISPADLRREVSQGRVLLVAQEPSQQCPQLNIRGPATFGNAHNKHSDKENVDPGAR